MQFVPTGSFERIARLETLWTAYLDMSRGKRRHPGMARFHIDADRHILKLQRDLLSGRYRPESSRLKIIFDPKKRLIAAPAIRDRVLHHALVSVIAPTFERSFLPQSFACGHGRGPHRAVLLFLREMRRYRFRLGLDIARYFPSIHLPTLEALFARKLQDPPTLDLLHVVLAAGPEIYRTPLALEALSRTIDEWDKDRGLPLGSCLSQWTGAFYLDGLDHFVKRDLEIPGYLRYMDDFVLFDDDANRLRDARARIIEWLAEKRALRLKFAEVEPVGTNAPCVFLGYRVSRSGISPSKKLRRRFKRRVRRAAQRGPDALVRTLRSYRGLLLF